MSICKEKAITGAKNIIRKAECRTKKNKKITTKKDDKNRMGNHIQIMHNGIILATF